MSLSRANTDRLNAALRKARRWGITDLEISMEDLIERSDQCCIKYILKVFQLQNTNYIFKLYFKYFSQLLLKSSTQYKIQNTFSKSNSNTKYI